jgi:pantoate--beta-alanine ligase
VTELLRTRESLSAALGALHRPSALRGSSALRGPVGVRDPVVLVPTMGALHEGHRALLRAARAHGGPVMASIFVNPLQFGPGEDLDRYPQMLESDLAMCSEEGVVAVFAPSAAEMYPSGKPSVTVDPGPLGAMLEGEFRPGFFGGVLTVVAKLFGLVRPDVAVFGEKDAQQLAIVRRMVRDLDLGVRIAAVPTVRDPDGLAMSSRNRYLSDAERAAALALPKALQAASSCASNAGVSSILATAQSILDSEPGLVVDYLALVDPDTFAAVTGPGPAVLAVAARVGTTRLIDNVRIDLPGGA